LPSHNADKFSAPQTLNPKEVYATFLSTRIGTNHELGEFEDDYYFNSTRVLIHRLLRTPSTRSTRHVVVSPSSIMINLRSWSLRMLHSGNENVLLLTVRL
jgi:alpha-N-acetylglucosamine transferase